MKIYFTNSLSKKKEKFKSIKKNQVGLYTCGPTVYDYPHLGNLRSYIIWDILKRFLISQDYKVKHVMNITDVGHLVSDDDEGEDKMEKSSKRLRKTAWEVAIFFINIFKKNLKDLNILKPSKFLRATETIKKQIEFVNILYKKGYLYKIKDGLYFDTSKINNYGILANLNKIKLKEGARVKKNKEKKNITDFAVWKFSPKNKKRDMEWTSPWGIGFPGWHLECSVISKIELGNTFDIHTGGVDHLTIHHPNEMAQSEAVTGKLQANYWLHNSFVKFNNNKMSKSSNGFISLEDLKKKGYNCMDYRFLVLQTHYKKSLNFTWKSLEAARKGLKNIIKEIAFYDKPLVGCSKLEGEFYKAISDDLNTSQALSILQKIIDSNYHSSAKLKSIFKIDEVLGLNLKVLRKKSLDIPKKAKEILKKRDIARNNRDWKLSDKLRKDLQDINIEVKDSKEGQKAIKIL